MQPCVRACAAPCVAADTKHVLGAAEVTSFDDVIVLGWVRFVVVSLMA